MKTIQLLQQLNSFDQPDTQSNLVGKIGKGFYEFSEIKMNYPDSDTDYAKIFDQDLQRYVWICSRYKDANYATIEEQENKTVYDFLEDDLAIDERYLVQLLDKFNHFTYDLHHPTYPFPLQGIKVPQSPPSQNNCCTFVEGLIVKAWQNATGNFPWGNQQHGQMMIYSAEDYFSPITCLVDQKMALTIENVDSSPQNWTAVQGWKSRWAGGHTFIILDYHPETDRVLTLESNMAFQLNGVGYRSIGNIKTHPHPGANWWQNDSLWTWERVKHTYQYRKLAKLKVKNVQWVANGNPEST